MKRIIIVGTSGSGKTTLGKTLSNILGIKYTDLDDQYWLPNWQPRETEEFKKLVYNLTEDISWIIGGNYSNVQEISWQRSDTIIWLDYHILRCLYQAFLRSIRRIIRHESCCNNNYETIRKSFFSKDSILLWIIYTYKKRKNFYNAAFNNKINGKIYLRFKNPFKLKYWLVNLARKQGT